ncbi:hypothetical protein C8R42DRAFT_728565 [Lentinula raphanica]|nr:hypothetical protein C8R42DRAFT_728565 [Lentinula raphanica]
MFDLSGRAPEPTPSNGGINAPWNEENVDSLPPSVNDRPAMASASDRIQHTFDISGRAPERTPSNGGIITPWNGQNVDALPPSDNDRPMASGSDSREQHAYPRDPFDSVAIPLPPSATEDSSYSPEHTPGPASEMNTPLDMNPLLREPPLRSPLPLGTPTYIVPSHVPVPSSSDTAAPIGRVEFQIPHNRGIASDNGIENSPAPESSGSEIPSPRVRWNTPNRRLPRWDTPHPRSESNPPVQHTQAPALHSIPLPNSTPLPHNNPPPNVIPTYLSHLTPLWGSNPPRLMSFPSIPLSQPGPTSPWPYTPHPLPLNPATPIYSAPIMMTPNPSLPSRSLHASPNRMHSSPATQGPTPSAQPYQYYNGFAFTPEAPVMTGRHLGTEAPDAGSYEHQPQSSGEQGRTPQLSHVVRSINDRPHEEFYLVDGNIELRVHNVLFRVHAYFFSRAKAFRIFGLYLPQVVDLNCYGLEPSELEWLLRIFYPKTYGTLEIRNIEGWTSVLKVSSALGMDDIRNLAVTQILQLASPADVVVLARTSSFVDHRMLVLAVKELCLRREPLTEEEGRKLGTEFLVKLHRIQHELQHNTAQYLDSDKVDRMLRRVVEI